jgi:hypothetical protein
MNVIYPYCKGALFDIINVITWLHMQLIDSCYMVCQKSSKKPPTKTPKNPLKIPHPKIHGKNL